MALVPVRILTKEERAASGNLQRFWCDLCHEEIGNGLRWTDTPHCTECGEHHTDKVNHEM